MTDDLQQIDGIGPAREESMHETGYETYADLAEADPDELGEEIPNLSSDKALEIVVQAQNLADLEEASVEENPSVEEDSDDSEEDDVTDVETAEDEQTFNEDGPETTADSFDATFEFELSVERPNEYDALYHTLLDHRATLKRTNREGIETFDEFLDSLRSVEPDGSVSAEMNEEELNNLHSAILQKRMGYQGDNLIEEMEALKQVEQRLNDIRDRFLF